MKLQNALFFSSTYTFKTMCNKSETAKGFLKLTFYRLQRILIKTLQKNTKNTQTLYFIKLQNVL